MCVCVYIYIYIYRERERERERERDFEKLAHVIKEAEKFHDLPCANWGPRNTSDVIQWV